MKRSDWRGWRAALAPFRYVAAVVLAVWAGGLAVAGVQLAAWNDELVRTLLQIRADSVFRTRMAQRNETIPREWYRSKALALLAASEKLQDDGRWMLFLPGSWRPFDDLRDRLAVRIEREFNEIAVDTMRRELYFRASVLTGVAQDARSGALLVNGGCGMPPVPRFPVAAIGAARDVPEALAVQTHLEALEQLDLAVKAMSALQDPATAEAEQLRILVRYTLGAEVPGPLSRSTSFFKGGLGPADPSGTALGMAHLRYAVRCSVEKAMAALDTRVYRHDELLATESYLAQRTARLSSPGARAVPHAETMQMLRDIVAALDQEEALLARGDHAWLQGSQAGLGPLHDALIERASAIQLLGPDASEHVRRRSALAAQQFRERFTRSLAGGNEPALAWSPDRLRLGLSPQRLALRDGLANLLREPFMAQPAGLVLPTSAPAPLSWDVQRLAHALSLAGERRRFITESLPKFPPSVQGGVAQIVHGQLAQLVQDGLVEAMIPAASAEAPVVFDAAAFRAQRELLSKVQTLLAQLGARDRAERLRVLLAHDLLERLALAEQTLWRSPLFSSRTEDFSWWQGEGAPILQAFGAADTLTLKYLLAQQFAQVDEAGRSAAVLLAYADSSIAYSPSAVRWRGTVAALERWRAGSGGSAVALQRYLLGAAGQVNRGNCVEQLAMTPVPDPNGDEFARRQANMHRALQRRCMELRNSGRLW